MSYNGPAVLDLLKKLFAAYRQPIGQRHLTSSLLTTQFHYSRPSTDKCD